MLDDVNIVQSTEVPFEEAVPADDLMHFHLQFIVFCQSPPTKNFCHPPSPVGGRIPRKKVCASKKRKGKEHKRFTQKWTAFGVFPKKLRVFVSVLRYKNRCPGKKGAGRILSDEHEAEWCSKCSFPVFSLGTMCRTTTVVQYTTVACPVRSQENRDSSGGGGKGKRHKKRGGGAKARSGDEI